MPRPDADGTCPVRTGDIIPDFAVDRSSNAATRGNLYAVWMDTRFNDPDHNDILLSRSTDGGVSWDAPVVVDHTPAGVDAFTATVDVDGTGRVAVSYYDFRNDETGDAELSTDFWVTHSHDGGVTFPDEDRLTPESFDMRTAPFALGYFVGDYTGLSHFERPVRLALGRRQRRRPGQPHRRVPPERRIDADEAPRPTTVAAPATDALQRIPAPLPGSHYAGLEVAARATGRAPTCERVASFGTASSRDLKAPRRSPRHPRR